MNTVPTSNRLYSIVVLYDMHTGYLVKALENITDSDAHNRLNTKANHVAWLAGSIVQERYELATLLGVDKKQQAYDLFSNNKGIQDDVTYPSINLFIQDWHLITPLLRQVLVNVTDEKLDETFEMMPGYKMSYFDLITFMTYREANIIGQIALYRRLLGYPAMNYM